jgi:NhaP-type Na+/H+ or K+/H+ antiporter
MSPSVLIAVSIVLFCWAVLSERIAASNITGPLVFLVAGFALGNPTWGVVTVDIDSSTVHDLAELTLALLLFADASKVRLGAARADVPLTGRLLGIGLPLTVVGGAVLAVVLFPDLPLALAGLIAAGLAPTDAALSASVISDERLPGVVRRVLNVESGLNDGIVTPVVTFCIASAATVLGLTTHGSEGGFNALGQIVVGVGIGGGLAAVGGRALATAHRRGWMQHGARRLATLALALLSFLVASELGGNPFVAAFVAGLVFGAVSGADTVESVELAELGGGLLSLVLWFVFGAGLVLPALEDLDAAVIAYAVCSLTVVRMVPVALALAGAGQHRSTVAFIGWFGPRGLASVVFALLALEELGESDPRVLAALHTITVTIALSVVAHGLTARPLAGRYVARLAAADRRAAPGSPVVG